jgi:multicomponent Na+:H+ antiporter subunit G
MLIVLLDILTVAALLFGLFFMFIGALGLWRLPDLYNRMHAGSKCITLGVTGMLLAGVCHFARLEASGLLAQTDEAGSAALAAVTKGCLVIIFQFVAAPVAAHMLARAAHLDRAPMWPGTIADELAADETGS